MAICSNSLGLSAVLDRKTSPDAEVRLIDGDGLSIETIDARARHVAGSLRRREGVGARCILAMAPGPDYFAAFFGCLYAGVLPVPAPPPRGRSGTARTRLIAAECQAASIICDDGAQASAADVGIAPRCFSELVEAQPADPREADPADIAYLQFTSGSTATPRAVMISHAAAQANIAAIRKKARIGDGWAVSWLPLYHDMGLITSLAVIECGLNLAIMAPRLFSRRPWAWLEAMTRYRAAFSGAPAFAYDVLSRIREPADAAPIDLSAWAVAFCGAEPIRPAVLRRFNHRFAAAGLRPTALAPCYGLAEFTLMATTAAAHEPMRFTPYTPLDGPPGEVCEVGEVINGHRLRIIDPDRFQLLEDGRVGEVVLDGPSKGSGYWNRPAESRATFEVRIVGEEGSFLRTGDLGFVRNGRLNIVGRHKEMVIVRGRNLHPAELELVVCAAHPGLKAAAAFSLGTGEVGLVCETRARDGFPKLFQAIQRELGRQLTVNAQLIALVRPGGIPRTTSGKIRRLACPELLESGAMRALSVWRASTDREPDIEPGGQPDALAIREWLLSYLSDRFGADAESLDGTAPFHSVGLDSLAAVDLACALEDWLHIPLEATLLWQAPSLDALCDHLQQRLASDLSDGEARPTEDESALVRIETMSEQQIHSLSRMWGIPNGG